MITERLCNNAPAFPLLSSRVITRTRLHQRLSDSQNVRFHTYTAPAGFGKTTLVRSWLQENDLSAVWFAVGEKTSLREFCVSLLEAFTQAGIKLSDSTLASDFSCGDAEPEYLAGKLIEQLSCACKNIDVLNLVMDDLDKLADTSVVKLLEHILPRLPENLHVHLISRNHVCSTLLSSVAWHDTMHIGADELEFTFDEAEAYLRVLQSEGFMEELSFGMYKCLSKALWKESEGWPVFFCALANQSLNHGAFITVPEDISLLPGFAKFLKTEVVDSLTTAERKCCEKLCRLEHFNFAMLEECIQMEAFDLCAQNVLLPQDLIVRNISIESAHCIRKPLKAWFLSQITDDDNIVTVKKAVQWWLDNGHYCQALITCISNSDWQLATEILESNFMEICTSSESIEVWDLVQSIPDIYFKNRPRLLRIKAEIALLDDSPRTALVLLNKARNCIRFDVAENNIINSRLIAEIDGLISSTQALYFDGTVVPVTTEEDALLLIRFHAALHSYRLGELKSAQLQLRNLAQEALENHKALFVKILPVLSRIHFLLGQDDIWKATIAAFQEQNLKYSNGLPADVWKLAFVDTAETTNEARSKINQFFLNYNNLDYMFYEKLTSFSQLCDSKQWSRAQWELKELEILTEKLPSAMRTTVPTPHSLKSEFLHLQGHTHEALQLISQRSGEYPEQSFAALYDQVVFCELLVFANRAVEALPLFCDIMTMAKARSDLYLQVRVLIAQAIAYQRRGKMDQADAQFSEALSLGRLLHYPKLFVRKESKDLQQLLVRAQDKLSFRYYVQSLIELYGDSFSFEKADNALIETLSKREKEVLDLLVQGLSNPEIASVLCRSLGTVKIHVHNIYRKLGAPNRLAAINKYRQAVA